jgi:hypothetical protein
MLRRVIHILKKMEPLLSSIRSFIIISDFPVVLKSCDYMYFQHKDVTLALMGRRIVIVQGLKIARKMKRYCSAYKSLFHI